MKKQVFTLIIVVFISAMANGVSAQQTPMPGWTEVTAAQADPQYAGVPSYIPPIIIVHPDYGWSIVWYEDRYCPSLGECDKILLRRFNQNNQPSSPITEVSMNQPPNRRLREGIIAAVGDQEGNTYVAYEESEWLNQASEIILAKFDSAGSIVFRRVLQRNNQAFLYPKLVLGSDGEFSVFFADSNYQFWFMRANRDGVVTVPPVAYPFLIYIDMLITGGQGYVYATHRRSISGTIVLGYYKLNERTGNVVAGPITVSQGSSVISSNAAYFGGSLHLLWGESDNNVYYAKYDTTTNQPVIAPRVLFAINQGRRASSYSSLAIANDGSRVNIVHFDLDSSLSNPNNKVYLMQVDAAGTTTMPLTLLAESATGIKPESISKVAQVGDRPYFLVVNNIVSPDALIAKIYDPQITGPENPYTESCNVYHINAPLQNSQNYVVAASFGISPGTPLPGGRTLPLNPDALLFLSIAGNLIRNNLGVLDNNGRTTFRIRLPEGLPNNLQFYLAFLTSNQQVGFISKPKFQQIQTQC